MLDAILDICELKNSSIRKACQQRVLWKSCLSTNEYMQSNGLLEGFQSAYRKMHNTETALVKIVNDLLVCADQRKV